jgi:uncharacterized protein YaaR (DUF327 family)
MPRTAEQPAPNYEIESDAPAFEISRADLARFEFLRQAFLEQTRTEADEIEVTADMIEFAADEEGLTNDEQAANSRTVKKAFQFEDEEAAIISALAQGISLEPGERVPPQAAPVAENAPASLPKADLADPSRREMLKAVREVARLEAMIVKGRGTPEDRAMLEQAREVFEAKRLEYVGENFSRFADAQRQQIEARRERMEKKKGFMADAYRVYEKMGELNLEALGWKPKDGVKKFIAKNVSVKTAVPLALLAGGFALGAGSAAGMGALFAKRLLAGPMAGMGAYGSLMNRTERKLSKPLEPEKVKELDLKEILNRMDAMAGNMLMSGKSPSENEAYKQLEARLVEITEKGRANLQKSGEWGGRAQMKEIMENADVRLAKAHKKAKTGKNVKKGIGAALGIFTGSGALAHVFGGVTHWFGETFGAVKGGAKVAAQSALESHAPNASQADLHHAPTAEHQPTKPSAARSGGTTRGVRTPRAPRVSSVAHATQAPAAAPKPSGFVESTQRGTKIAGFHTETAQAPAPAEAHTPGAEARMTPRPAPPEAQHPNATATSRETLRPLEVTTPDEYRLPNGEVHFYRDSMGAIKKVVIDVRGMGANLNEVLKDNWLTEAMKHDPNANWGLMRSALEGRARVILQYKTALKELTGRSGVSSEALKFLDSTIKKSSKLITDRYGDIIK